MKELICKSCGAKEFTQSDGLYICCYCKTQYQKTSIDTTIALDDDVSMLLAKCKTDPKNAGMYANLILDIDPTNIDALKYL